MIPSILIRPYYNQRGYNGQQSQSLLLVYKLKAQDCDNRDTALLYTYANISRMKHRFATLFPTRSRFANCQLSSVLMRLVGSDKLLFRRCMRRAVVAPVLTLMLNVDALRLVVLLPEVLLAAREPLHPGWHYATRNAPRPVLLLLLVVRDNTATGSLLNNVDNRVDENVRADTGNQSICDGVGKWHDCDREEGRDSVTHVAPVDILCGLGHQRANDDQGAASCPRWNRGKDRRKENGDEEAETREHCSKTSLASLRNTRSGFDEGGDGRRTKERADGNTDGVDTVGDGRVLEILGALVDLTSEASHGV
jgi:hypothetical protein